MSSEDIQNRNHYSKQLELNLCPVPILAGLYTGICLCLIALVRLGLVLSLVATASVFGGVAAIAIAAALVLPGLVLGFFAIRQRRYFSFAVLLVGLTAGGIIAWLFLLRYVIENPKFP